MIAPAPIPAAPPPTASSLLSGLAIWRFAPAVLDKPVRYDDRLDGLRGFAACSVMIVHGIGDGAGGPLSASSEYVRHLHMSRSAVLLFFVLSGYVIGLTNRKTFSPGNAREYLARRFLRIVPIYLIALVAGWIADRSVPWTNVLANALFLQNIGWDIAPLQGNGPVWSLHFEMIYYLGFILLWRWAPRVLPLAITFVIVAAADWCLGGFFSVPGSLAAGALFWLAGLVLAWSRLESGTAPILAFLFLGYAANHFWPGVILMNGIGLPRVGASSVWLSDLFLLPACVVVFCALLNAGFPGLRFVRGLAIAIPAGTCVLLALLGRLWENVPWTMASVATAAGLILLAGEPRGWGEAFFRWFRPLGRISFGLYLFHVPAATLVVALYPWRTGAANYLGAVAAWIGTTLLLAWLCEARLQPRLTAWYRARRARTC